MTDDQNTRRRVALLADENEVIDLTAYTIDAAALLVQGEPLESGGGASLLLDWKADEQAAVNGVSVPIDGPGVYLFSGRVEQTGPIVGGSGDYWMMRPRNGGAAFSLPGRGHYMMGGSMFAYASDGSENCHRIIMAAQKTPIQFQAVMHYGGARGFSIHSFAAADSIFGSVMVETKVSAKANQAIDEVLVAFEGATVTIGAAAGHFLKAWKL